MTDQARTDGKADDPWLIVTWERGVTPIFVEKFESGMCIFTRVPAEGMLFNSKKKARGTAVLYGLIGAYAFRRRSEFTAQPKP